MHDKKLPFTCLKYLSLLLKLSNIKRFFTLQFLILKIEGEFIRYMPSIINCIEFI